MTQLSDIKSHFKTFVDFDISDEVLTVHFMINEEDEQTEFELWIFRDWVEKEHAKYGLVWIYPEPTEHLKDPLPYAVEVDEYIRDNQKELVEEFWEKHK